MYAAFAYFAHRYIFSKAASFSPKAADWIVAVALLVVPFLPASGLFMEVGFVLAERILYLPSMGFCLLLALVVDRIGSRVTLLKPIAAILVLVVLALYSARTLSRNEVSAVENWLCVLKNLTLLLL